MPPQTITHDYSVTALVHMQGTMPEVRPGAWRLRVYAGRRPNGTPIQITKTVKAAEARPGAGKRLAERALDIDMLRYLSEGKF